MKIFAVVVLQGLFREFLCDGSDLQGAANSNRKPLRLAPGEKQKLSAHLQLYQNPRLVPDVWGRIWV